MTTIYLFLVWLLGWASACIWLRICELESEDDK